MANRKKVLIVITKSNPGGAQRYVKDLAEQLPTDTFEVVVAAGHSNVPGSGWLQQELNRAHIRTVTLQNLERDIQNPLKEFQLFISLWSLIKRERPDILHVNSAKAGGFGALIGRMCGVKRIIFTAHGWASNEDRSCASRSIIKILEWFTIILSHTTVMNSHATSRHVEKLPFVKKKTRTIHLGITPFETLSREAARKELHLPTDAIVVGSIAELHRNKGIDVLVRTLEKLPQFHACVIGDGTLRPSIERAVDGGHMRARVTLPGALPNAKKYLHAFDMFVLPSRTESLGYVLLEAGSTALPIVATNVGGIPEIIEHEITGLLVPPNNEVALAEALERINTDTALSQKMAGNIAQKVSSEFTLQQMIKETVGVYTERA